MDEVKTITRKSCTGWEEILIADGAVVWPPGDKVVRQELQWQREYREHLARMIWEYHQRFVTVKPAPAHFASSEGSAL